MFDALSCALASRKTRHFRTKHEPLGSWPVVFVTLNLVLYGLFMYGIWNFRLTSEEAVKRRLQLRGISRTRRDQDFEPAGIEA